jgi:hypothetical protein
VRVDLIKNAGALRRHFRICLIAPQIAALKTSRQDFAVNTV